ncbi:MAG: efflux RND transporter periplasmic adaptor subunit [Candidatus Competibacteraceae bacterium]|nr:efflux RND transporter periplasmic adaptor subunit [Candidatus Competibacteraceae bacterium]
MDEDRSPDPRSRLRPDLIVRDVADAQGNHRYQVRNPATGEQFELGEEEWFLCRQLDETADPTTIQGLFASRFGFNISTEQLSGFYREMASLGLLSAPVSQAGPDLSSVAEADREIAEPESPTSSDGRPAPSKERLGQRYRWEFFKAGAFLAGAARRLRWLHRIVWLLVPGVPLALLVILHHQPRYLQELRSIDQVGFHLIVKLTVGLFLVNLTSKLLQGTVSAYYGGQVSGFGVRLAFGIIPRFFVGRGVRRLARRERLWVYAVPLLVKLGFFVLGILVWQFNLHSSSRLGSYGFVLGHLALGEALFIINPLWRAEGYAWLTTYLDFPHLRERAFVVLRLALRNAHPLKLLAPREKYALLAYGFAAVAYFLLIVGTVLLGAAVHLESQMHGVGVLLFLALVAGFLAWALPYLRSPPTVRDGGGIAFFPPSSGWGVGNATVPPSPPAAGNVIAPPKLPSSSPVKQPPKSRFKRWLTRLALLALIGALFLLPYPYEVTGGATLLPNRRAEVHATVPGVVTEVGVRENQTLQQSAVLARLSDWRPRYDVASTRAELERKRNELELLLHGPKPEAIAYAQHQVDLARIKAASSKKLQDVLAVAAKQGVAPELRYTEAIGNAEADKAALAVAEANLQLVKSPPQPLEVAIKRAELQQLNEQLSYFQQQLEATQLRAPIAGRVVTPRLEFKQGSFLKEGDLFATLEETQKIQVEVLVPETDIGAVQLEAPVTLRVWAHPLRDFKGKVSLIADTAESLVDNPSVRAVRVVTLIDNPDGLLKAEMTGYAKIAAGREPIIVAFTRALVRFVMLEMWSWLP